MNFIQHICRRLGRKKTISIDDTNTNLKRCLTLKQLIFIGVGKTVGVGIYVLIGVATQQAGPGVIFSFLIAFLVTLLNALCFSEYASKSQKTGAQYTYMYETIGEGVAFIVGWTSCVGFTAAFSLAARGWSGYLDSFFNHRIENYTETHVAHWTRGPPFPEYPDLPAIGIVLLIMIIVSLGVNFASVINTVLASVSVGLLMFIVVFGLVYANFDNWFHEGVQGFFPNGFAGVLKAAASCFYAYQGFDIIGYSAEETVNPKKTIPRSIVSLLLVVTVVYLSVAISFTLMIPLSVINTKAPFPNAFGYHSVMWAKYLVAAGPVLALSNLCMLEMFGLQRLAYSMSTDGLLFRCLSNVNKCTNVPIGPVLVFGPIVIVLVLVIDLSNLIGFMNIFIFIQYTLFSGYLIILRYNESSNAEISQVMDTNETMLKDSRAPEDDCDESEFQAENRNQAIQEDTKELILRKPDSESEQNRKFQIEENSAKRGCAHDFFDKLFGRISVNQLVCLIYVLTFSLALDFIHGPPGLVLNVVICTVIGVPLVFATFLIWSQEQEGNKCGFLVPMMPFLPVTCMLFNMVMLLSVADKGSTLAAIVMVVVVNKFVDHNRLPHLLFYGPPGTGKTSTILAVAKQLYTPAEFHSMVLELNASDDRGIGIVRGQVLNFASTRTIFRKGFKLVILDEADAMTRDAQNSLRRVIEKFTDNVRFCIICNYLSKIIPALQSRCTRFRFGPLSTEQMLPRLEHVIITEGVNITEDGKKAVVTLANGDMRKSLNILQSAFMAYDEINEDTVYTCVGHPLRKDIENIVYWILNENFTTAYNNTMELKTAKGLALQDILTEVHQYVHKVDLPLHVRLHLLEKMADIEYRLASGTSEKIQLSSLIAAFQITRDMIVEEAK